MKSKREMYKERDKVHNKMKSEECQDFRCLRSKINRKGTVILNVSYDKH